MPDKQPPLDPVLACATADMLAMPHMVCRRRRCRRKNSCRLYCKPSGEPSCLINLTAEQRRIFDLFYDKARVVRYLLGVGDHTFTSGFVGLRLLEDAAVEITRTIPRWDLKRWNAARRARETAPPPDLYL